MRNLTGKGYTCSWLTKRHIATRARRADGLFFWFPTALETYIHKTVGLKKKISTATHTITSKLLRIMTQNLFRFFSESLCVTQRQDPAARVGLQSIRQYKTKPSEREKG